LKTFLAAWIRDEDGGLAAGVEVEDFSFFCYDWLAKNTKIRLELTIRLWTLALLPMAVSKPWKPVFVVLVILLKQSHDLLFSARAKYRVRIFRRLCSGDLPSVYTDLESTSVCSECFMHWSAKSLVLSSPCDLCAIFVSTDRNHYYEIPGTVWHTTWTTERRNQDEMRLNDHPQTFPLSILGKACRSFRSHTTVLVRGAILVLVFI